MSSKKTHITDTENNKVFPETTIDQVFEANGTDKFKVVQEFTEAEWEAKSDTEKAKIPLAKVLKKFVQRASAILYKDGKSVESALDTLNNDLSAKGNCDLIMILTHNYGVGSKTITDEKTFSDYKELYFCAEYEGMQFPIITMPIGAILLNTWYRLNFYNVSQSTWSYNNYFQIVNDTTIQYNSNNSNIYVYGIK